MMKMSLSYKNGELQSVNCVNGKQLTNAHLHRIAKAENPISEAIRIYNELL